MRPRDRCTLLFALVAAAMTSACAKPSLPVLPRITEKPTQLVIPGKFVWMDLVTQDPAAAQAFYSGLFGWSFDSHRDEDGEYLRILHGGRAIGGVIRAEDPKRPAEWIGSLSVEDVDGATDFARENGGAVERGPLDAPNRGRMSLVSDTEEAIVLILRASDGDPEDVVPALGDWLWRELSSHDIEAARTFYTGLAGYESETLDVGGNEYVVLRSGGRARAGILLAPSFMTPHWLPYVRVEEPKRVAERAKELGGRIVVSDADSAILIDPTGAPIAIQEWNEKPIPRGEPNR